MELALAKAAEAGYAWLLTSIKAGKCARHEHIRVMDQEQNQSRAYIILHF
jgi:hypothetical protein